LYVFPTCNIVNFLINLTFLTATYFFKCTVYPICAESAVKIINKSVIHTSMPRSTQRAVTIELSSWTFDPLSPWPTKCVKLNIRNQLILRSMTSPKCQCTA